VHLCIPEKLRAELDLEEQEKCTVRTVDGKKHSVPYVGPVKISFNENRSCLTGALVLSPLRKEITVNPLSPDVPMSIATGVC
jgi:hypothetical protein